MTELNYASQRRLHGPRLVPFPSKSGCQHQESKTVEGNNVRCNQCKRIVGFVEAPKTSR